MADTRRYDPTPSLLRYPLPTPDRPQNKRARLSADQENESIERRILAGTYSSLDELIEDVNRARDSLLTDKPHVNGDAGSPSIDAHVRNQINLICDTIAKVREKTKRYSQMEENARDSTTRNGTPFVSAQDAGQVLSLRSQTEKGPQQLFSGLPKKSIKDGKIAEVDGRKLPNGFELTDLVTLDAEVLKTTNKDKRTFGEVFKPHRNSKTLEFPRASRSVSRSANLSFQPVDEILAPKPASHKHDYRYSSLPAGLWQRNSDDPQRRKREQGMALNAKEQEAEALFHAVYGSFAPTSDNTNAVISEDERNQLWWSKYGSEKMSSIVQSQYPDPEADTGHASAGTDEFADVVANFEPPQSEIPAREKAENLDTDDVLEGVSELLETLSSQQRIRNLRTAPTEPLLEETSTFEMLKTQLTLLVATFPPFAVARLNGDHLRELNISTEVLVASSDYRGTGQPDEYTIRKARAAQSAVTATARTTSATPQVRTGSYVGATPYNQAARGYNANVTVPQSVTAYSARPAAPTVYQTPRPQATVSRPSYTAQAYGQGTAGFASTPTISQFQRPIQNGYSYGTGTPSTATHPQRPSQPGYQQRAQDNVLYGRSTSPPNPALNGQTATPAGYSQRQYPSQSAQAAGVSPAERYGTADQRAMIERLKTTQQYQAQRQGSNTSHPSTPGAAHTGYNGTNERTGTPAAADGAQTQATDIGPGAA